MTPSKSISVKKCSRITSHCITEAHPSTVTAHESWNPEANWKASRQLSKLESLSQEAQHAREHLSAVLTVYLHLGREGPGETGQFQKHPEAFGLLTS